MADPPSPTDPTTIVVPTEEQNARWATFEQYTAASGAALEGVGNIGSKVTGVFASLSDKLQSAGISLSSLPLDETSRQFGLLTTSLLGAREAFTQIVGVDTTRLVTYTSQFKELFDIIKSAPGTQAAMAAMEKLKQMTMTTMAAMGKTPAEITAAVAKIGGDLAKGIGASAEAFFTSADNIKRLENSMIQMTLAGSGMQDLLKAVGSDFQNLDATTRKYSESLTKATAALGGSKAAQELAANYMAIINKMPGGLGILTQKTMIAGQANDFLTETIKIASISGRKEEEVLEDITTVLKHYKSAQDDSNVTAGAAATLQARMATIAGTLGANIQDVRSALMESTDAFKMFVMGGANVSNMTKGMAESMESYTASLESVGVPASNAIEMFKNYTKVMQGMTVGQQAFMSTMSGGPGGLRGAFQVQDRIAKGDFEGLRKDAETTIKRLTGPIVSREQAMQSESAAANYMRQIQLLQQGPLGGLAKSVPEAQALLKAMSEGKKLPTQITTDKSRDNQMQAAMKTGEKIQQDSYTELTKINQSLNSLVLQAGLANKKTTREMLGTGNTGAYAGGVGGGGGGITPGRTGIGVPSNDALQQVSDIARNLPRTVQDAWASFKEALKIGNKESIQQANDKMVAAIKDQRAVWNTLNTEQRAAMTTVQQAFGAVKPTAAPTNQAGTGGTRFTFNPPQNTVRAARQLPSPLQPTNGASATATTGGRPGAGGIGHGTPGQAVPVMLAPGSAITVNLTGVCPHCGRDINHSQTDRQVSPQTGANGA